MCYTRTPLINNIQPSCTSHTLYTSYPIYLIHIQILKYSKRKPAYKLDALKKLFRERVAVEVATEGGKRWVSRDLVGQVRYVYSLYLYLCVGFHMLFAAFASAAYIYTSLYSIFMYVIYNTITIIILAYLFLSYTSYYSIAW